MRIGHQFEFWNVFLVNGVVGVRTRHTIIVFVELLTWLLLLDTVWCDAERFAREAARVLMVRHAVVLAGTRVFVAVHCLHDRVSRTPRH